MKTTRNIRIKHRYKSHPLIFSLFAIIGTVVFLPVAILLELIKPRRR